MKKASTFMLGFILTYSTAGYGMFGPSLQSRLYQTIVQYLMQRKKEKKKSKVDNPQVKIISKNK